MRSIYVPALVICLICALIGIGVFSFFPQASESLLSPLLTKVSNVLVGMWEQLFTAAKAEYLIILAVCIVIDLVFLGYKKSALSNLAKPDMSTRSDIYIFLIGLFGLRYYLVMFSFLLVGYFSANWVETHMAFNWLHNIDSTILQLLVYMLIYDFMDYWIHRFAHRVSWWWEVHRFHHSATKFNIITVGRTHPLDLSFASLLTMIPLALMGVPLEQIFIITVLRSMLGKLQHSMVDWDFGILGKYILMSPVAHRIHHSPYPEHWDKHYGHTFIFWDRLFGTYYDGDFVNDRVGLSNTTDNQKGLIYDLVMGQINFFKAFFFRKWSFSEGVMTKKDVENYTANNPHIKTPVE